ncbi:Exodeoxyribonuclease VII large subunit [Alkalibacterium sp. AK22]|uniref:exodeoxyribonuclease VII large subunit n=1 Tax=Alkalibacterium sp. AK22 TaxID=1229520 RepID=UPI000445395F|nr:exodeoxyribonuclease VII large subunit [Alkalibacterium sp. AK22]EXJ22767.1 Exodeoxyribonuclease VII large subunit [Alkalibacterium sp. AK22]
MAEDYLTVSQLTSYIKRKFDCDPYLEKVFVKGEISNYNPYRKNTHQYFSIKDKGAKLSAVLFQREAKKMTVELEDGMSVMAVGRLSLYEKNGTYQLYIDHIEPEGLGQLYAAYEQTKKKLAEQGWFDAERKKELVRFPRKIAVVTSASGAVIRDIQTTLDRRFPIAELTLFPTVVQGEKAADSIVKSIEAADLEGVFDTIIVARGGGSFEDLFPFNEERVALAIAKAQTPLISSVGHETDTTLSDLAADVRAATPTAAAELAVPLLTEELARIDRTRQRLTQAVQSQIRQEKDRLSRVQRSYIFRQPKRLYEGYSQNLDQLTEELLRHTEQQLNTVRQQIQITDQRLNSYNPLALIKQADKDNVRLFQQLTGAMNHRFQQETRELNHLIQSLDYLSPLNILGRGYAITKKEETVVKTTAQVRPDDEIQVMLHDGNLNAVVSIVEKKERSDRDDKENV